MRVIAGKYKGRALITLSDNSVRPTTDRVKESVFNLIRGEFEGKAVLDLFAGSGALGIEFLSRGASEAVFVDKSPDAIKIIKQNLSKIGADGEVYNADYSTALSKFAAAGRKFGAIALDPPYEEGLEAEILRKIALKDILEDDGVIVLERLKENDSYIIPEPLALCDTRTYGSTGIDILRKKTKAAVTGTFDPFTKGHLYLVEQALERFDIAHVVFLINPEKAVTFDLKKRMRFAELSTRHLGKRVMVSSYGGLTIDYCKRHGIKYIIRGYRNEKDLEYEKAMAEFNLNNGGVETIMIPAKDSNISSTLVKEGIKENKDISGLVNPEIAGEIMREGKRWKT